MRKEQKMEISNSVTTAYIGANGNWYVNNEDTGVKAQGPSGHQGPVGPQGEIGPKGETGDRGPQGLQGPAGEQGVQGPKGEKGETGPKGEKGEDAGREKVEELQNQVLALNGSISALRLGKADKTQLGVVQIKSLQTVYKTGLQVKAGEYSYINITYGTVLSRLPLIVVKSTQHCLASVIEEKTDSVDLKLEGLCNANDAHVYAYVIGI